MRENLDVEKKNPLANILSVKLRSSKLRYSWT